MKKSSLRDINYTVWPRGSWDESYIFAEQKVPCFVVGLPIFHPTKLLGDAMHTYQAFTTPDRIAKFRRVIEAVDMEFG